MREEIGIKHLLGKTITKITGMEEESSEIIFTLDTGEKVVMYHEQDCCEAVYVESVVGDITDLIGSPILRADEETNEECPGVDLTDLVDTCHIWTFYKLATRKGYVDLRWYGGSNGYYSVSVDFKIIKEK